jgi:hypothetical protein
VICCCSCAGKLRDPERFEFLLDASVDAGAKGAPACATMLFRAKCNQSICHAAGAPQVDLVSDGVEGRLVDQPSSDHGMCKGMTLISTDGSPSLLLLKVGNSPPCGSKMPLTGAALTSDETKCLTNWVADLSGMHADGGS